MFSSASILPLNGLCRNHYAASAGSSCSGNGCTTTHFKVSRWATSWNVSGILKIIYLSSFDFSHILTITQASPRGCLLTAHVEKELNAKHLVFWWVFEPKSPASSNLVKFELCFSPLLVNVCVIHSLFSHLYKFLL